MSSTIVLSPFSNNEIKDWPLQRFAELVPLILERWDGTIAVIGTKAQRVRADALVRGFDPVRVANICGRTSWPELLAQLRQAACIIGNDSGITHLGGMFDVPTICIYSGSHRVTEWRALGRSVVTLSGAIGCAPCHKHDIADCPYDVACLRMIDARAVADVLWRVCRRAPGNALGARETA